MSRPPGRRSTPARRTRPSFLAPLDPVSARGRAKPLFDFEYVWEVYKPVDQRRWGYYTLPVLWGDRLVARFDSKLDRSTDTLVINGLWLEDGALARDAAFADGDARGACAGSGSSSMPGGWMRAQSRSRGYGGP